MASIGQILAGDGTTGERAVERLNKKAPQGLFYEFEYIASSAAGFLPRGSGGRPNRFRAREIAFGV